MNVKSKMRTFVLERHEDVSGTSGTGIVAEGVEFTSGMIALTWLSPYHCVNVYDNIKTVELVHGHDGRTKVAWQ